MERNYKLYLHTTPSGKRYYGITKQRPERRWSNGYGYKNNQHFWRAITKYGWDNITHEILFDDLTESEAKELEQYYIQWYDTANRDYGYNISLGGEGTSGYFHSEETRQKMSEAQKGKNNPRYGKHHTEETRQKMSEAKKGERNHNYGKHLSEETRQKMSEVKAGKNNPRAKSIICITTKRIFFATREGAKYYDIKNNTNISHCCQGKLKSAGKLPDGTKLVWRYLNHNHNKTYRVATS